MNQNLVEQSLADLNRRWIRARVASSSGIIQNPVTTEEELINHLPSLGEGEFDSLLKSLFLNSRQLGRGYQKYIGLSWEREDFLKYLGQFNSPCLSGQWIQRERAVVLTRQGCVSGLENGYRFCQYWREAIDGLVLGISDDVGYARHRSICSGDPHCEDVFFEEDSGSDRYASLPEEMREELAGIENEFLDRGVHLQFLGLMENCLMYRLEPIKEQICGSTGHRLRYQIKARVVARFPAIKLRDASPLAVYGERA